MPKEIVVQKREPGQAHDQVRAARMLLITGADNGDDDVLDRAIEIAFKEGYDVVFRIDGSDKLLTPELAYNLRYHRGIDIREKKET